MSHPSNNRSKTRAAPKLLALEDRAQPAIITVTSLADNTTVDGAVTLREAIQAAETDGSVDGSTAGSGDDTIDFAPGLFTGGDQTISLSVTGDTAAGASAFQITTKIAVIGPDDDNGLTLQGGGAASNNRFAYVTSTGDLTLMNLNVSGFRHRGGNGADAANNSGAGGGAAGMGGVIFNEGSLAVVRSTLSGNFAEGGNGGSGNGGSPGGGGGLASASGGTDGGGPNGGLSPAGAGGFGGGGAAGGNGATKGAAGGRGGNAGFGGGGGGGGAGNGGGKGGAGGTGGFGGGGGGGGSGSTPIFSSGGFGGGIGAAAVNSSSVGPGGGGAGLGGAIFNHGGTVVVTNSTLAGNTTTGGTGGSAGESIGGAIFTRNGTVTVLNSTLAGNSANSGGGAVFAVGDAGTANVTLNNAILADTVASATDFGSDTINSGSTSFAGTNNLIESNASVGFTGGFIGVDPALAALTDNGGPTLTMAIADTSAAYNAGSNAAATGLTTDQRGEARVADGTVDIGAFEFAADPGGGGISVQIDTGDKQRSMIRHITLTYPAPVAVGDQPAEFGQIGLTRMTPLTGLTITGKWSGDGTMLKLTFSGTAVTGGSLPDGRYTLTNGLDTLLASTELHRLFGDLDGDTDVDETDQTAFNLAMNTRRNVVYVSPPGKAYNEFFDFNSDNYVNSRDQSQFTSRFKTDI